VTGVNVPDIGIPSGEERRRGEDRRQYNRRATDRSPPYYQVFERIALALEQIEADLRTREGARRRR
jgi:hypothetical protein